MCFVPTQESESHSSCKTDLSSVCSYSNLKKGIKIYQKIENKMKIYNYTFKNYTIWHS